MISLSDFEKARLTEKFAVLKRNLPDDDDDALLRRLLQGQK